MPLVDEVHAQLKAFVDGRLSAHELAGWLDSVAAELHTPGEERPRRVVGQVYVALSELGYGDRTAKSTRAVVVRLLGELDAARLNKAEPSAGVTSGSPPV